MDEHEIIGRIDRLVDEEHELRQRHPDGLSDAEQERLAHLEVQLDQAWDLLRQRRARQHADLDPEEAKMRDEDTVERYQQ
jgi:hypothetical protein